MTHFVSQCCTRRSPLLLHCAVWQISDPSVLARVNSPVKQASRTPFAGIAKSEPLPAHLTGFCSRRITGEHRLVHSVSGKSKAPPLEFSACRFHYD